MSLTGKNYEELSSRQQRNRRHQIRNNAIQYYEHYISQIGLQAYSLNLKTTIGNLVQLNLSSDREPVTATTTEPQLLNVTSNLIFLLLKYGISQECYHELTKELDSLPRTFLQGS